MSVINKMLQELDRRNAVAASGNEPGPQPVKPPQAKRGGHEWFWRITAVLVLASVAWVGWVAYQLQPRTVLTPLALKAAPVPTSTPPVPAAPAPVAAQPEAPKPAPEPSPPAVEPAKPAAEPAKPAPEPAKQAERAETFKLARSIDTPIAERRPEAPKPKPEAKKPEAKKPLEAKVVPATPPVAKAMVDKRERAKVNEAAEAYFRRAAALLHQGRVSEAEDQLRAALQAEPSHVPARQAYVALLLDHQRVEEALRLLRDAVAVNPSQPTFALALARIHAEHRDYRSALDVMDKSGPAAEAADFQALRGAVLQRLGRHADAVSAYQKAVETSPQQGGTWTGLAISLEATGRGAEAAQAYQRALGAGPIARELREYAEARIKALQ